MTKVQKTKLTVSMNVENYLPSQQIIVENKPGQQKMYLIRKGTCNLMVQNTKEMYKKFQVEEDPTLRKRNQEKRSLDNPNSMQSLKTKLSTKQNSKTNPVDMVQKNGYLSKTMHAVNLS